MSQATDRTARGPRSGYTQSHWNWLARVLDVEAFERPGGYGYTDPGPWPEPKPERRNWSARRRTRP